MMVMVSIGAIQYMATSYMRLLSTENLILKITLILIIVLVTAWNYLAFQWLKLHTSNAGDGGCIPDPRN